MIRVKHQGIIMPASSCNVVGFKTPLVLLKEAFKSLLLR